MRGPARGPVGLCAMARVLPGVKIEAVEGAGSGEQKRDGQEIEAQLWKARDGGDEDRGGEEDADGEFLGQAVCAVARQRTRVDDEEPCAEQRGEQRVNARRVWIDLAE